MHFARLGFVISLSACGASTPAPAAPPLAPSARPLALAPAPTSAAPPAVERAANEPAPRSEASAGPGTRGVGLAPSVSSASAPRFSTSFVASSAGGAARPLVSGDRLRSGDHFWLELSAQEQLYVYVVYVSANGSASVLYPSAGDLALAAGRTQRLPESQDFLLDSATGWERLLVVASREPLARSKSSLAEIVTQVRATHRWPGPAPASSSTRARAATRVPAVARDHDGAASGAPSPDPEPSLATSDTRGIVLGDSPPGRVDALPDSDGVIAIPLLIDHQS